MHRFYKYVDADWNEEDGVKTSDNVLNLYTTDEFFIREAVLEQKQDPATILAKAHRVFGGRNYVAVKILRYIEELEKSVPVCI